MVSTGITKRATSEARSRAAWLLPLGLFGVVVLLDLPLLKAPVSGLDEGTLLAYSTRVFAGAVPYRDFMTFYGPANPYVIGLVMQVFGPHLAVERTGAFVYKAAVVLAFYSLPLPGSRLTRAALALIVAIAILPLGAGGSAALAVFPALAALLAAISLTTGGPGILSRRRFLLAGFCLGIAVLYRLDFVLPVTTASVPIVWRRPRDRVLALLAGLGLGLALFVLVIAVAGVGSFVSDLHDWLRSAPGRRLPIPGGEDGAAFASTIVGPIALIVVGWRARSRNRRTARTLSALGMCLLGLIPYEASRRKSRQLAVRPRHRAARRGDRIRVCVDGPSTRQVGRGPDARMPRRDRCGDALADGRGTLCPRPDAQASWPGVLRNRGGPERGP